MPTASQLTDPTVLLVTEIMIVMAGMLAFAALWTLALIIFNKFYWAWYRDKHRRYTEWIVSLIISPEDTPALMPQIYERPVLRDALVDLVMVMKGAEKVQLRSLYVEHGFLEQDVRELRDRRWHIRLEALVRLDLWQEIPDWETKGLLLYDDHLTVRLMALKNLSRTEDKDHARVLIDALLKEDLEHASHEFEIIYRLAVNHLDLLIEALQDPRARGLLPTFMKVFGDRRSLKTVPLLIEVASSAPDVEARENALVSLGKIEDPRGLSVLLQALSSEISSERLAAMHALYVIDPGHFKEYREQLESDPDPVVARWSHFYARTGA